MLITTSKSQKRFVQTTSVYSVRLSGADAATSIIRRTTNKTLFSQHGTLESDVVHQPPEDNQRKQNPAALEEPDIVEIRPASVAERVQHLAPPWREYRTRETYMWTGTRRET